MYFWEFLETCTIGWVWICEGGVVLARGTLKNAFFFEKFYRGHHLPHPRRSLYTPPVEASAPAHPERLHSTGSNTGYARCKADRPQQTTHRHTRPDAGHATPGRSGRRRVRRSACAECPKLHRYGQHNFATFYQKNKSEKSYIFIQKGLTYKIYLI